MMEARNIGVEADGHPILKKVCARLQTGEVSVILGPNGAGKSTLLRCLTGALRPHTGEVVLDGRPLSDYGLVDLAKRRAVLSQSAAVTFPFTVDEIVQMGRNPHITKHPGARDLQIIDRILNKVDAYPLKRRVFPTLSGGEQQRVQLARVLAQIWEEEQAYLFLDEPTAALDLKHQHKVLQLVKNMAAEKGWAVVMVLHDLRLAKMYGDHALLMKDGEVVLRDTTAKALVAPNITDIFEIPPELAPV